MTGYKDPPKEHQFKKGEGGRPKGALNFKTRVMKALLKTLEYPDLTKPGTKEKKKGPMINFMIDALVAQAIKGNTKAFEILLERVEGKVPTKVDINDSESYVNKKDKLSKLSKEELKAHFEIQKKLNEV